MTRARLIVALALLALAACAQPAQRELQSIQDAARARFMGQTDICQPFADRVAADLDQRGMAYRRIYATIHGRLHTAIQVGGQILDSNQIWVVPLRLLDEYDTGAHATAAQAQLAYQQRYGDGGRMKWLDAH